MCLYEKRLKKKETKQIEIKKTKNDMKNLEKGPSICKLIPKSANRKFVSKKLVVVEALPGVGCFLLLTMLNFFKICS